MRTSAAGEVRVWTDASGQRKVEAEFVTHQAERAWFHRMDGRVFGVALDDLSQADQAFLQNEIRRRERVKGTTENPPGRVAYGTGHTVATLANKAVEESSGIACSRRLDGAFWTHNDSGGDAQIYLFDRNGRDLGACRLEGVDAFDWEDMASFERDGKDYLLVGDCGNNGLAATVHVLHLVEEPKADQEMGVLSKTVPVAQTIFLTFEDDHRDCEALAVDTASDCIYLATKQRGGGTLVYELPWSKIEPDKAVPAKRIATLEIPPATAMDISPDGRRAVILTYGNAYEYQRENGESWQQAFARPARRIVVPERIQGESICYGKDGKTLYLTSEIVPTPLIEVAAAEEGEHRLAVQTPRFHTTLADGCLVELETAGGKVLVRPSADSPRFVVHREGTAAAAATSEGPAEPTGEGEVTVRHSGFEGLADGVGKTLVRTDTASSDVIVKQDYRGGTPGVWGVGWSIGRIPLEYSIIVPGHSGLRLTRDMPGRQMQFDYPRSWEAQLVIVEGEGHGFYVWAEDPNGRYKRLVVERDRDGWELSFITENDAPFDGKTSCESVPWHVNVYEGDWRVPARRYRDWAVTQFCPVPIEEQRPEWIRDIRVMVILGMDLKQLDLLATRLDPAQTVLYVPSWRAAGYDRDYPTYDRPLEGLKPFIARAHELGFRVMLHVNYFGVDPKNPLYEQFEPFQVRNCFGSHERQWWLWTRAEPEIRFAYINPALKAWRDLFTERMVKLCRDYDVDALHLDQTLCIDNDHNGRIDGLSMLEGNLALHRQLREALPDVALSGEGLNEVTYRHEAFAQRHAFGISHSEGTWDRERLALAHPISSYLFRRYTIINGYLGCAPPSQGQLYAAWNEAYEHWGVIPTLKPQGIDFGNPTGFARQFFDEAAFWQNRRLQIDLDGEWPASVAFPFRTDDGRRVERTVDGRMVFGKETVCQTISGATSIETAGTIAGWRAHDAERFFGLDPQRWYAVFPEPRSTGKFHVCRMPDGMIARSIVVLNELAMIRTESSKSVVADLVERLETAQGGSRPFHGDGYEDTGPFSGEDGAAFQREADDRLFAHPPWKARQTNPSTGKPDSSGTGVAYVRYSLELPGDGRLRFLTDVAMRASSVGQPNSDGATFRVTVRANDVERSAEIHQAADTGVPLELDLTDLGGQRVELELSIHPGPKRSPSFDWALWIRPRVEMDRSVEDTLSVAGGAPWSSALDASGSRELAADGSAQSVRTSFPGTIILLRDAPKPVAFPCDLTAADRQVCFLDETGQQWSTPQVASVQVGESRVGGTSLRGLFAHPPDGGRTVVLLPMRLLADAAAFRTRVGLRDGSKSTGVRFILEVNGQTLADELVLPGAWHDLEVDLSAWQDRPIVLGLVTDSAGSFYFDWAHWGQPRLEVK
ncbi:MAG: hypothetical protein GXX96_16930 [Planctomycetaceae bacterium]|nr:hypothetical protein [Planctomycetaceae bacterium]